jgi:hypothetical protein
VEGEAVPVDAERVQAIFLGAAEQESTVDRAAVLDRQRGGDADLDALRAREDFEQLLRELEEGPAESESEKPEPRESPS